jgi:hypothetical protein
VNGGGWPARGSRVEDQRGSSLVLTDGGHPRGRRPFDDDVLAGGPPVRTIAPVITPTHGLAWRLRIFCSSQPVQNANGPSSQTSHERRRVRTSVDADRDDPIELREGEEPLDVVSRWCGGRRIAVPRVDLSDCHAI